MSTRYFMRTRSLHAHSLTSCALAHFVRTRSLHAHSLTSCALAHFMCTRSLHEHSLLHAHSLTSCALAHFMRTSSLYLIPKPGHHSDTCLDDTTGIFRSAQQRWFKHTVTPRYNAVVGRHLLGLPYKRGVLWDPVDLVDIVIPRLASRPQVPNVPRLEVEFVIL